MATPTARPFNIASDGSGNGDRVSSNLFFALVVALLGLYLSTLGRRGWKLTTGLALGLTVGLGSWAIAVSAQGDHRLMIRDWYIVLIFALTFLVAFALGAWKLWPIGIGMLGLAAGFSLGLEICLLGDDGTIHNHAARYIVIGVLAFCTLVLNISLLNFTSAFCCSQIGAFMLFLGIDLLVNFDRGWSRGLRFVLDANSVHRQLLRNYDLPVSSRIFVGLAWLFALISGYLQYRFSRSPFIRLHDRHRALTDIERPPRRASISKSPLPPSSPPPPALTIEVASPLQDTYSETGDRPSSRAGSGRDASLFSMLTQQFRSHWAGALSQYGSSIDLSSRPSPSRQNSASILHPLRSLNPDQPTPTTGAHEPSETTRQMALAETSYFSDTTRTTMTTAAVLPGGQYDGTIRG